MNLVFAYTGWDDGADGQKTVTLTGKDGVKIAVNGEEKTLPYTGSFEKGAEVKIEVLSVRTALNLMPSATRSASEARST